MTSFKPVSLILLASPLASAGGKCGVGLNPIYGPFDQQLRPLHASWWYNWAPTPNVTDHAVEAQFTSTVMDFTWGIGDDAKACIQIGACSSPWFLSGEFCFNDKINTHPVPEGGYFEESGEFLKGLRPVVEALHNRVAHPKVISPSIQPSKPDAAGGVDEILKLQRQIFETCRQASDCPLTHMGVHVSGCNGNEAVEHIKKYADLATELNTKLVVQPLFVGFDERCLDASTEQVSDFMRTAIAHILTDDRVERVGWMSYDLRQSTDPKSKGWNNVLEGELLDTYNKACDGNAVIV